MAQAPTTPLQDSQPGQSATNPRLQKVEDPDAWEYEYSTTETETYYVTLDLTTPNVEPRRRPKPNPAFQDSKGRWKNHGIASQRRDRPPSPKSYRFSVGEDEETATPAVEMEDSQKVGGEDDPAEGNLENNGALKEEEEEEEETKEKEEEAKPPPVQILDLHSENPLVSYRGQVFSCEWASNIGTELLFMAHDDNSDLPVLRSLPGDVDLLAASSCRLISKAITLEPRLSARSRMATALPYSLETGNNGSVISIPVGQAASQKRRDQARFLEGLMTIKREKGEEDLVTVITQKRQLNNKWKLIYRRRRQGEKARLMKFIRDEARSALAREEVEKAKQRLKEMDDEDGATTNLMPASGEKDEIALKRSGRKKKTESGGHDLATSTRTTPRAARGGRMSITGTPTRPTPRGARVKAEDEMDEDTEDDEIYEASEMEYGEEDEGLYDEDGPVGSLYD